MQVHFDKWTCTSPGSSAPVEIENIECSRACRGYCGLREVEWSVSQSCGDVCVLGCALDHAHEDSDEPESEMCSTFLGWVMHAREMFLWGPSAPVHEIQG